MGTGFPSLAQIFVMAPVASLPLCILGMLPNAVLADITVHDALLTGLSNEGMFFAARTFVQKIGSTLGVLVFASLTNFGRSPGDDLGVRLSGPACVVVMTTAGVLFSFYDEKTVLGDIQAHSGVQFTNTCDSGNASSSSITDSGGGGGGGGGGGRGGGPAPEAATSGAGAASQEGVGTAAATVSAAIDEPTGASGMGPDAHPPSWDADADAGANMGANASPPR